LTELKEASSKETKGKAGIMSKDTISLPAEKYHLRTYIYMNI